MLLKLQFERKQAEFRNSDRARLYGHFAYLDFIQLLILFELELTKVKLSEPLPFVNDFSKESLYSEISVYKDSLLKSDTTPMARKV